MPQQSAQVFEDGIDLQIGLLEAVIPASRANWPGYPFPHLQVTDAQEMRTFRTIVLENPLIRVTLLPGMGGRIVSLFDKRTGTEILKRHTAIEPQPGGRRGAFVREGIQLFLDGEERLNALGNVSTLIEADEDEEAGAVVVLGKTFTGTGLSFHVKISLPPDRAEVLIEATIFNRWLRPQTYNGGISAYLGPGTFDETAFYSPERDAGLAVLSDGMPFDGAGFDGERFSFTRFAEDVTLAPRQVDRWAIRLIPLSGLGGVSAASRYGAFHVQVDTLFVQVAEQRLGHKILLLTEDGRTLEAPVDLYPEIVLDLSIEGLNPTSIVLIDPAKTELLRLDRQPSSTSQSQPLPSVGLRIPPQGNEAKQNREEVGVADPEALVPYERSEVGKLANRESGRTGAAVSPFDRSETELRRWTFDIANRHLAHTLLGMKALAAHRYPDAAGEFEQALAYNAEDPLLWWAKSMAMRLSEEDNQAELLNAHYLAPLEPALRAEGYLSQPLTLDADPNPLLAPLAENPEEFIEVACLLLECGLFDQASRWIDEALRHRDMPMLRILMTYCLLSATRLDAEAFDQVRKATLSPPQPPFPFRDMERKAIARLLESFPANERLRTLQALFSVNQPVR